MDGSNDTYLCDTEEARGLLSLSGIGALQSVRA